jgi:polyhydroxyalkanoate synthesis regulator phasin
MEQIEEILELVKKKMQEQGGYDREAYKEYVEETIDYFIEKGKLSEEENTGLIEDTLLDLWDEVKDDLVN